MNPETQSSLGSISVGTRFNPPLAAKTMAQVWTGKTKLGPLKIAGHGAIVLQAQADLTKANAVEFNVRDEPWVKYKLEDGTMLFGRLVIPKIFRADEFDQTGQPIYAWSSQNLFTTICPRPLRGTPTNPPPTNIDPATTNTTAVDFERIGPERWNVYELSDGTVLRAKLEITSILRTDKYGPDGDPLYIVNNQPITRVKVPESLLRKQKIISKDTRPKGLYG